MSWIITPQQKFDPDAAIYIAAVETADGQALETAVRNAINAFVVGCKADGIWSAIRASCILAGARTLAGALVPLAGAAPTNFNFVSGDYNRKTGLVGDGSTKYLDSNRDNNSDPQNNVHLCVYASAANTGTAFYSGFNTSLNGVVNILRLNADLACRNRTSATNVLTGQGGNTGFIGLSRSTSTTSLLRSAGSTNSFSTGSFAPPAGDIHVFGTGGLTTDRSNARLAFYSIGESLDLALLDARVTALINAFAAAIP